MSIFTDNQRKISFCLKTIVILSAVIGIILSANAGRGFFMGGMRTFMYFTTQSNIAMAIISAVGIYYIQQEKPVRWIWNILKYLGTVSITLTGVVFCLLLAPVLGDKAWTIQNILTHVVVPVASVADFFLIARSIRISKKSVFLVVVPPLLYVIYAGIGYAKGWEFADGRNYPYFFLNWGSPAGAFGLISELPFFGTAWWIIILLVFLILVGRLYLAIADYLRKKSSNNKQ
ncbi:Pr6Pr family membrane protein [Butyrivibrio sp. WCD3002]|uniref:Pr6Pr family membrane protein n=1 Tax=Butyrivibrio sp. WCD3002 TaxID=1280676 RepID=UPI0004059423|nr:Pr6Pr family membrane protein [Butyrivibrio sp. WCD3002]